MVHLSASASKWRSAHIQMQYRLKHDYNYHLFPRAILSRKIHICERPYNTQVIKENQADSAETSPRIKVICRRVSRVLRFSC